MAVASCFSAVFPPSFAFLGRVLENLAVHPGRTAGFACWNLKVLPRGGMDAVATSVKGPATESSSLCIAISFPDSFDCSYITIGINPNRSNCCQNLLITLVATSLYPVLDPL